jgi:hypothetical protein
MPNWCYNYATFEHEDPTMVARVVEAAEAQKLFDTFVPMPDRLRETNSPSGVNEELVAEFGSSNWYEWALANWGTKWDANVTGEADVFDDGKGVLLYFETAWSPPIEFYHCMKLLGFVVHASFTEEGMGFAGIYNDGEHEEMEMSQLYEMEEADAEEFLSEIEDDDFRIVVTEEYYRYLEMKDNTDE